MISYPDARSQAAFLLSAPHRTQAWRRRQSRVGLDVADSCGKFREDEAKFGQVAQCGGSSAGNLRVRRSAGFVFAARRRAIGLINQDVIVARGTHDAVNRLAELIVRSAAGVFAARLFAADGHSAGSDMQTDLFYLKVRCETNESAGHRRGSNDCEYQERYPLE